MSPIFNWIKIALVLVNSNKTVVETLTFWKIKRLLEAKRDGKYETTTSKKSLRK